MDIHGRIRIIVPRASTADICRWVEGGIAYADRLDKLPSREREAVAQLFALYGLVANDHYKRIYRRNIDTLCRPFYPGVDNAPAA
ncbi:hypothetical protein V1318_13165 [Lysobacter sp. CCNWLW3]|uniref:hypothetical protein n=1 Tax=unclassified Lysobacter TaxID=2635362 RepID=UPI002FD23B79